MVKPAQTSKRKKKAQGKKSKKSEKMKMKKKTISRNAKKKMHAKAKHMFARKKKPASRIKLKASAKYAKKSGQVKKKISAKKSSGVKMKAKQKPIAPKAGKIRAHPDASKKPARAKTGAHAKTSAAAKAHANASAVSHSAKAAANAKTAKMPLSSKEQRKPRCIVLAGFGLNAELELAHAFSLAGADSKIVHFSDISSGKEKLEDYEIFAIPGGWSFGDDIAGGRVLSNKLRHTFRSQFDSFVASGKPILGVCNGFQTLVKLGALPNISGTSTQESTLTFNKSGRFEDRWVYLKPQKSVCKYFEGVAFINCPVRHGEGQFVPRDKKLLEALSKSGMVPIKYCDDKLDDSAGYPQNPNGSVENIAGICDPTGKILGLMPHPECSVIRTCFPRFTAGVSHEKNSIRFFENIVSEARRHVRKE